jgi:hypothetical protein
MSPSWCEFEEFDLPICPKLKEAISVPFCLIDVNTDVDNDTSLKKADLPPKAGPLVVLERRNIGDAPFCAPVGERLSWHFNKPDP